MFDALRFLQVCTLLDGGAGIVPEENVRTATGRAYYAAYLVARERLRQLGYSAPSTAGASKHQWLHIKLKTATLPSIRALGLHLGYLHQRRVEADYLLDAQLKYKAGYGLAQRDKATRWLSSFSQVSDADLQAHIQP